LRLVKSSTVGTLFCTATGYLLPRSRNGAVSACFQAVQPHHRLFVVIRRQVVTPDAVAILHRRAETESYRTGQRGGPTRAAYGTFNYPFRPHRTAVFAFRVLAANMEIERIMPIAVQTLRPNRI
jgi:hypothetical protein